MFLREREVWHRKILGFLYNRKPSWRVLSLVGLFIGYFCRKVLSFIREFPDQTHFNSTMIKDEASSSSATSSPSPLQFLPLVPPPPNQWPREREPKSEERGLFLIQLLIAVANHVANGSLDSANHGLEQISQLTSPEGDSMQRIVAYFAEALAHRVVKKWAGLHLALNSTNTVSVAERILVQRFFFELCPFLKLSYVITNQAIFEAMEGEKMIHVIDLNSSHPAQMIDLLQTLSARPEGPPHLRITGVHEQREVLEQMAIRLTEEAEKLDIPFQFNPIVAKLDSLDIESLRVKTGEALAVSSVLQLHTLLACDAAESSANNIRPSHHNNSPSPLQQNHHQQRPLKEWLKKDYSLSLLRTTTSPDSALSPLSSLNLSPKMESFLSELRGLSPKVVVVTEQESNNNGLTLMERISESLFFYGALFDCLESTVPRGSPERQRVEKMVFGEEIKNIVACEGAERKERHERLEKWALRLELAGFARVPLSYQGMMQATRLLRQCHVYGGYKIRDDNGCLIICWQDRPLFSVSAWRFRR